MIKFISYCKKTVINENIINSVIASLMLFIRRGNPALHFLDCFAKNARNDGIILCIKSLGLAITASLLLFGLTGCISSKYVEQKQYMLDVEKPTDGHKINKQSSLYIDHVATTAPFDQLNFLYRINEYQYLTDYYNGLLVPPAEQLETTLTNYVKNSSKFTIQSNALSASNILRVQLNEFYADYRDNKNPQAIINMRFVLSRSGDNKIILDKTFTQKAALQTKNTEGLLAAWNIGLQNILTNATKALNQCIM